VNVSPTFSPVFFPGSGDVIRSFRVEDRGKREWARSKRFTLLKRIDRRCWDRKCDYSPVKTVLLCPTLDNIRFLTAPNIAVCPVIFGTTGTHPCAALTPSSRFVVKLTQWEAFARNVNCAPRVDELSGLSWKGAPFVLCQHAHERRREGKVSNGRRARLRSRFGKDRSPHHSRDSIASTECAHRPKR
jgi:hypothetical protein